MLVRLFEVKFCSEELGEDGVVGIFQSGKASIDRSVVSGGPTSDKLSNLIGRSPCVVVGLGHHLPVHGRVDDLRKDGDDVGGLGQVFTCGHVQSQRMGRRFSQSIPVGVVNGAFKNGSSTGEHEQTLISEHVGCQMAGKKRWLEVHGVNLLVLGKDVLVFDIAEGKATGNANDRVVGGRVFTG